MLRVFRIGHQSLWIDEVFTWYNAGIGRTLEWSQVLENVHGPLYGVLLHAWGGCFGDSEAALRLPSALLGIATVPILAWFAARWLGASAAIPAAWLAAGSPFLVWYSQEARNYALVFPCVGLGALAMLELRRRVSLGAVAALVASSTAGLLANFSYGLLAPVFTAWWVGAPGRRGVRALALAAAALVLLVLLAPWLPQLAGAWDWKRLNPGSEYHVHDVPGTRPFRPGVYPFTLHAFSVGYSFGPSIRELRTTPTDRVLAAHVPELVVVVLLFGTLAFLAWRAAVRRHQLGAALLAVFAPALLVSYGALQNFKTFHPRYVAVSFPFLLALVAAAFADLRPRLRIALAVALGLVWTASLARHYFVPRYGKEDMRSAVAILKARAVMGEKIVAAGAEDVVFYYYRGPLPVERYWLGWAADSVRAGAHLDAARAGTAGVWFVWSRGEDLDPRGAFFLFMAREFPHAESWRTEGVRMWHLPGLPAAKAKNAAPAAPQAPTIR